MILDWSSSYFFLINLYLVTFTLIFLVAFQAKFWKGHDPHPLKDSLKLALNNNYFLKSDVFLLFTIFGLDFFFLQNLRLHIALFLMGVCSTTLSQYLGNSLIITSNGWIVNIVQKMSTDQETSCKHKKKLHKVTQLITCGIVSITVLTHLVILTLLVEILTRYTAIPLSQLTIYLYFYILGTILVSNNHRAYHY